MPRETHELKTHPGKFRAVETGVKRFEIRYNDRGYKAGDRLRLREWDPETEEYTGAELLVVVVYMLSGSIAPNVILPPDVVVMSLTLPLSTRPL